MMRRLFILGCRDNVPTVVLPDIVESFLEAERFHSVPSTVRGLVSRGRQ